MIDREDLIRAVKELATVRGHVTLASGKEVSCYADIRRVTLNGAASPPMERIASELMADLNFDMIRGSTLGADPVAIVMLHAKAATGGRLDAFVVHKEAKSYNLQHHIGGTDVAGRRVLVVENTSTMGESALTAVEVVRRTGGEVVAVAVVVDRAIGAAECVAETGLEYHYATGLEELGL